VLSHALAVCKEEPIDSDGKYPPRHFIFQQPPSENFKELNKLYRSDFVRDADSLDGLSTARDLDSLRQKEDKETASLLSEIERELMSRFGWTEPASVTTEKAANASGKRAYTKVHREIEQFNHSLFKYSCSPSNQSIPKTQAPSQRPLSTNKKTAARHRERSGGRSPVTSLAPWAIRSGTTSSPPRLCTRPARGAPRICCVLC
jgi:hypothetical protein